MKSFGLTAALVVAMCASAQAQGFRDRFKKRNEQKPAAPVLGGQPPRSFTPVPDGPGAENAAAGTRDPAVGKTIQLPPEPIPLEDIGQPKIPLPEGSIDHLLLRKEHGPFMVCAHVFRGPDATKYAHALVLELQNDYHLPAYIWHLKVQPGGSNIRNVQPTAPSYVSNGDVNVPEKFRVFDEAAVLVGNCPTIDDAEKILKQVKKIKPQSVDALPSIWGHRKGQGLYNAFLTANPLIPAQALYPGRNMHVVEGESPKNGEAFDPYVAVAALTRVKKPDALVLRMNEQSRHSIYRCPAPYTLPVAEFRGRTTANPNDARFKTDHFLKGSPLRQAHEDAEELANNLMKCAQMRGFQAYVFHDRDRSVVCIGAFNGVQDPNLKALHDRVPLLVGELISRQFTQLPLAPSTTLMEVPRP